MFSVWVILWMSAMAGHPEPQTAVFPDAESCLAAFATNSPRVAEKFPDAITSGGCIEVKLFPLAGSDASKSKTWLNPPFNILTISEGK